MENLERTFKFSYYENNYKVFSEMVRRRPFGLKDIHHVYWITEEHFMGEISYVYRIDYTRTSTIEMVLKATCQISLRTGEMKYSEKLETALITWKDDDYYPDFWEYMEF